MTVAEIDLQGLSPLSTISEVARWARKSTRGIQFAVKDGTFPSPIHVGKRSIRWRRSDLLSWLESQQV